jgi:hypothetical protein
MQLVIRNLVMNVDTIREFKTILQALFDLTNSREVYAILRAMCSMCENEVALKIGCFFLTLISSRYFAANRSSTDSESATKQISRIIHGGEFR